MTQTHASANEERTTPKGRPIDHLGIIACVFAGVLVLALSWFKLGSLDIGYHVAYGNHFLETGRIVGLEPDPFLYSETAKPFVNANWGSQVMMALAERAGGAGGLLGLRLTLIAIIFGGIAVVVRSRCRSWLAVGAAWTIASLAAYERFSMRPELFGYALMSVQLVLLTRGIRTWKTVVLLASIQLVWVNCHSYFLIGILLTLAWVIGTFGPSAARRAPTDQPTGANRRRERILLASALALQLLACLMNPRFVQGAVFPISTLQFLKGEAVMGGAAGDPSGSAWSEISEFQSPFSFRGEEICGRTIDAYYVLLALAAVGAILLSARKDWAGVLVMLGLFAMSTLMRRNIAQFAIAAVPLAVGVLGAWAPWSRLGEAFGRIMKTLAVFALATYACWSAVRVADGRFYYAERRIGREFGTGYSDRTFPRQALDWLERQSSLKPRLFVDYFSSSNTLQWLPERFKLFVNTNTFAYEDATLESAFDLGLGKIGHNDFFQRHEINLVLLHCGPDTQVLVRNLLADDGEWALVYFDRHEVIFARRIMEHVDVIRRNRLSQDDLDIAAWVASADGPAYAKALSLGTIVNVPMALNWARPAISILEEAVRLAPDYHEAWHYLGVCHGNLGNAAARERDLVSAKREWMKAVACFQKVLGLRPNRSEAADYLKRTEQQLEMMGAQ